MAPDTAEPAGPDGLVTRRSRHSAETTLARLEAAVVERGLSVFARFDHAAAAHAVGLPMPDASVLVFGSPRGGTPLMIAAPLIALELPLRALVWSDADGGVFISYVDPAYLGRRYGLPDELVRNIAGLGAIVEAAL